jgi:hypothetical protein
MEIITRNSLFSYPFYLQKIPVFTVTTVANMVKNSNVHQEISGVYQVPPVFLFRYTLV